MYNAEVDGVSTNCKKREKRPASTKVTTKCRNNTTTPRRYVQKRTGIQIQMFRAFVHSLCFQKLLPGQGDVAIVISRDISYFVSRPNLKLYLFCVLQEKQ